jgi:hypothetical protein
MLDSNRQQDGAGLQNSKSVNQNAGLVSALRFFYAIVFIKLRSPGMRFRGTDTTSKFATKHTSKTPH